MSKKYLDLDGLEEVVEQINAKYAQLTDIPTTPSEVGALPATTKYGASVTASVNTSTYVCTFQLKDQDGNNLGNPATIDLPIESAIVNASYDNTTKDLTFTLQNGNTVTVPMDAIISGLQEQLVSGTNIKTINGNSILGSGDLDVHDIKEITVSTNIWELGDGVYRGKLAYFNYKQNTPISTSASQTTIISVFSNSIGKQYVCYDSVVSNNTLIIYFVYGVANSTSGTRNGVAPVNLADTAITTAEIEALFS